MPYISQESRDDLDPIIDTLRYKVQFSPGADGLISYVIAELMKPYAQGNFSDMAKGVGVLESSKLEFYRMVVAPYEEIKRLERGDVY